MKAHQPLSNILEPEHLIIVSQKRPDNLMVLKVYEWDHFFVNPDPTYNQNQIAEYITESRGFGQRSKEIQDMYAGWSRIDKEHTIKLIGIHNQDPKSLFIQFSVGDRFFVYQRQLSYFQETVFEELFGKKDRFRLRPLNYCDEQYLITNLKFIPKAKKAISFYPKNQHGYSLSRSKKCIFQ